MAELMPEDERRLAAALFNRVWDLLERPNRSQSEDDEMLHAAHASRHHWGQIGEPINLARGEWQCSRVYAVLGRPEPALHHARRALEIAETHQASPFDIGCGHEALARAYRVAGELDASAQHVTHATALAEQIDDRVPSGLTASSGVSPRFAINPKGEERQILLGDLAQLR